MLKNKCSFHSLKFVLLFYKLKSPDLTWTPLVIVNTLHKGDNRDDDDDDDDDVYGCSEDNIFT